MNPLEYQDEEKRQKVHKLSSEILVLSRDSIIMNMRFMDVALSRLVLMRQEGLKGMASDGNNLFYDPAVVLRRYKAEPSYIVRTYLHCILHMIFYHPFQYQSLNMKYWDAATDIAVENVILEMNLPTFKIRKDAEMRQVIHNLQKYCPVLTAERIYKYFLLEQPDEERLQEFHLLFHRDEHVYWIEQEKLEMSMAQWKKLSERIKTDLKTFSKGQGNSDSLEKNLAEATKDKIDYSDILRRFTVMGEEIKPNDEEFDYIYYTYGLSHYGNMPLVEPLEYKETKKVKEFAIVIDTSASCRGKIVRGFLNRTYSILKSTENFFTRVNIHIIQCDAQIQSDVKITNDEEFDEYIKKGTLSGFGATDFRPAFEYVDALICDEAFENLKGLIYFTDGYGVYPEQMPQYDVIFAFLNEDEHRPPVPTWAIQVVLDSDEIEEMDDEH